MPVSSLEMATTGTSYFRASGRMASSFSSSPVTELIKGRPLATFSPASMAAVTEESMASGTSTRSCTICNVRTIRSGSVALGSTAVTPALMSSMVAPAATCSSASLMTVSKLPSTISAASFLRPVGLMRSPMTQNGRSKPMAISLVADATMVRVINLSSRMYEAASCGGCRGAGPGRRVLIPAADVAQDLLRRFQPGVVKNVV